MCPRQQRFARPDAKGTPFELQRGNGGRGITNQGDLSRKGSQIKSERQRVACERRNRVFFPSEKGITKRSLMMGSDGGSVWGFKKIRGENLCRTGKSRGLGVQGGERVGKEKRGIL